MVTDIIVGIIGASFVVLVIFLVMTLHRLRKVIKKTDRFLTEAHYLLRALGEPSVELIHHTDQLVMDIKKKSEGLDVIFHPLYELKKDRCEGSKTFDKICCLFEYALEGARLFTKIKNERKS